MKMIIKIFIAIIYVGYFEIALLYDFTYIILMLLI